MFFFPSVTGIGDVKLQILDQVSSLDAELDLEDVEVKPVKKKKPKIVKF